MKDRYKYRAKRLDNNEWYYGSYLYLHNAEKFDWNGTKHSTNEDVHYIIDENDVNYAVNSDTLCQCTGVKDKNKKLIYENDIVRFKDDITIKGSKTHISLVKHNEQFNAFMYHAECMGLYTVNNAQNERFRVEVIGNVFDNPELLAESEQQ